MKQIIDVTKARSRQRQLSSFSLGSAQRLVLW